jgi:hypothetical protein
MPIVGAGAIEKEDIETVIRAKVVDAPKGAVVRYGERPTEDRVRRGDRSD